MLVLIAEDDLIAREVLRRRLLRMGYEVHEATNGQEALSSMQKLPVQCLITDWMMPILDGLELVERVRKGDFKQYVYIILLTSRTDVDDMVAGLEAGADDYLVKPFHERELRARLGIAERIINLEQSLREARDEMELLATRDALTELYNRRTITEHAASELERARREEKQLAFVLLDVDHFKTVNDRFGHLVGDDALRQIAQVLRESRRQYDWVGRWGGEEFLVILPNTTRQQAYEVAERLRKRIADQHLQVQGKQQNLSASFGIAVAEPGHTYSLDFLLQQADHALYQAKAGGRNQVKLFDPSLSVNHWPTSAGNPRRETVQEKDTEAS